jgi:hypothetical protein
MGWAKMLGGLCHAPEKPGRNALGVGAARAHGVGAPARNITERGLGRPRAQ